LFVLLLLRLLLLLLFSALLPLELSRIGKKSCKSALCEELTTDDRSPLVSGRELVLLFVPLLDASDELLLLLLLLSLLLLLPSSGIAKKFDRSTPVLDDEDVSGGELAMVFVPLLVAESVELLLLLLALLLLLLLLLLLALLLLLLLLLLSSLTSGEGKKFATTGVATESLPTLTRCKALPSSSSSSFPLSRSSGEKKDENSGITPSVSESAVRSLNLGLSLSMEVEGDEEAFWSFSTLFLLKLLLARLVPSSSPSPSPVRRRLTSSTPSEMLSSRCPSSFVCPPLFLILLLLLDPPPASLGEGGDKYSTPFPPSAWGTKAASIPGAHKPMASAASSVGMVPWLASPLPAAPEPGLPFTVKPNSTSFRTRRTRAQV
jgi:hypothetical protein